MGNLKILSGLLHRIGRATDRPFTLKSFNDRLVYEKTIYLLQAFGIKLGYNYSWYLRGPYSSEVMDDGYELYRQYTSKGMELPDDIKFTSSGEARFNEFLRFLGETGMDPFFLEVLASIVFVKKAYGYTEEETIKNTIQKTKPVDDQQFNEAITLLRKYSLI